MKKVIILALVFLTSLTTFSQTDSTKHTSDYGGYLCAGLSMSNNKDFYIGSYPSIEGGVTYKKLAFGLQFGRGNLSGINSTDNINNYYYEVKTTLSTPSFMGLSGCVFFGGGQYLDTPKSFVEYGLGVCISTKTKFSYGLSVSNWDNAYYLTPSITLSF